MEKPKALKGDFSGYASVRIDKKNRIIFSVDENTVTVIQRAVIMTTNDRVAELP